MIAVLSVASLCASGALSYVSTRSPDRTARYELWSGRLMLAGLVLIGSSLPLTR